MSTLNVAIAGFGTIGSGVAHVLSQHGEHPDTKINLVGILERDIQGAYVRSIFEQNPKLFYENLEQLLNDNEVDGYQPIFNDNDEVEEESTTIEFMRI